MNRRESPDPEIIVGEQLSAVSFVQDYVEFHFDGPVLRAISNPRVEANALRLVFPENESRDLLCSLIGSQVCKISIRERECFIVEFKGGNRIVIPLDGSCGPESAHFQAGLINAPLAVW